MLKEFKAFLMKGNILELAVAVVIGGVFGAVVKSFTEDILMQIIGAIGGQPDFSTLVINIGDGQIKYGAFLNTLFTFIIVSFAIFMLLKAVARAMPKKEEAAAGPSEEVQLLTEIRDSLRNR